MTNEINAQNELDLILKGMEEIDNRVQDEASVELDYIDGDELLEYLADDEAQEETLLEELNVAEETVATAEAEELVEVVEVVAPAEDVVANDIPEKKGILSGIFSNKKKSDQQLADEEAKRQELEASQKKIEELEEISAERLAELEKLSFAADEMRKQTLQLERHTLSLEEKTKQLNEEKEAIRKEADALESLLQEKYIRIEELEGMLQDPDVISGIGLEITSNDIRTMIRDILADIKAMSTEAMVNFTLKVDDIYDPVVYCDRDRINSMIIKMIFCGLRYSETGEQLSFTISQKEPVASEYAEYIYSCVYRGDVVDFYSDEAAEMGGIVDIKRGEDGLVDISVHFRFKIDIPELREKTVQFAKSAMEEKIEQE